MTTLDRAGLADFLRTRREALQPEDVGLPRGPRRRTAGLRREEAAALCQMSADYYGRLEQRRGPQPSEQMLGSIARGLRLTLDERDHLFRLAGRGAPSRAVAARHVNPGMMRVLDRLHDTPAQVLNALAETLVQTPPAVALFGDETAYDGPDRSGVHRWFTGTHDRSFYPPEAQPAHGRLLVARLRAEATREGPRSRAAALARTLQGTSAEFADLWAEHDVRVEYERAKRLLHPELGPVDVQCQVLLDPDGSQMLLVYTATPGSESEEKLRLLSVLGAQRVG